VAVYDTLKVSPEVTVLLPAVKSPAENNVPVVSSLVAEPPMLMKQPATVPEPVIENTSGVEVALAPAAAALNVGV
jgi:hypothetical protein